MRAQKPRILTPQQLQNIHGVFEVITKTRKVIKTIPGRRWNPREKVWEIPLNEENLQLVVAMFPGIKVYPEIRQILVEKQGRWTKLQSGSLILRMPKPLGPIPLKTKPHIPGRSYQYGYNNPFYGLFEQGCGKTITSIGIMGIRYKRGEISKVLVVCPPDLLPVWPKSSNNTQTSMSTGSAGRL